MIISEEAQLKTREHYICHIADFFPEYGGGFIDSVLLLAQICRNRMRAETLCIFPDLARKRSWLQHLEQAGIPCLFVPRKKNVVSHIREHLRAIDPLILHTHFFLYDISTVFVKALFNRDVKLVWHYHNPLDQTLRKRLKSTLKIRVLEPYFVEKLVAVGDAVYETLLACGLDAQKICLIYNGVDTVKYCANSHLRNIVRDSLEISDTQTVFLLLGWDPLRKGLDVFLKAAEDVANRPGAFVFLVLGREETSHFLSNSTLSDKIKRYFKVIEPVGDFAALLSAIDVLVSASRSEGFPYSILEAMAAERLVISSELPATRHTYGKSDGVWVYDTENPAALASLMRKAIELPSVEINSLRAHNREFVNQTYSLNLWANTIVDLYESLVKTQTY
jgi:glycosyltransferase involved in cell wall biosynthesis